MAWANNWHSYDFGEGLINFRSGWELNYAFYLEWLKKNGEIQSWEYEPERYHFWRTEGNTKFAIGNGYLPDFRVVNKPGHKHPFYLVELKGYEQGMMKLKRMKKFYPDIPIEFVDKKEYAVLKKKVGKMLNFY